MSFGGTPFPENNIIIFDRTNNELDSSGYTLNTSGTGVRCFGTNSTGVGYSSETYDVNGSTQRISKIVTEMADFMINLSVLKNHGTGGVTLCLKNHYGTCNSPGSLHGGNCDPYIPDLNSKAPIRDTQCVFICDALLGIRSGGPSGNPQFAANTFIISQDIVACDYWGRQILADNGCTTTGIATHIDTAVSYGLGTNDPGQMEVETITDASGIDYPEPDSRGNGLLLEQNQPNPFSGSTRIRFLVPQPAEVRLTVVDAQGRAVRSLAAGGLGAGWHELSWDGRSDTGDAVASGIYFCHLRAGTSEKAITMQLVR
jgi:hypothetical protein